MHTSQVMRCLNIYNSFDQIGLELLTWKLKTFGITVINLGGERDFWRQQMGTIKGRRVGDVLFLIWSHCQPKFEKGPNLRELEGVTWHLPSGTVTFCYWKGSVPGKPQEGGRILGPNVRSTEGISYRKCWAPNSVAVLLLSRHLVEKWPLSISPMLRDWKSVE